MVVADTNESEAEGGPTSSTSIRYTYSARAVLAYIYAAAVARTAPSGPGTRGILPLRATPALALMRIGCRQQPIALHCAGRVVRCRPRRRGEETELADQGGDAGAEGGGHGQVTSNPNPNLSSQTLTRTLTPSRTLTLALALSLSLRLSLSPRPSLSLHPRLSLSLRLHPRLSLSLSLALALTLTLAVTLTLTLTLTPTLTVTLTPTLTLTLTLTRRGSAPFPL